MDLSLLKSKETTNNTKNNINTQNNEIVTQNKSTEQKLSHESTEQKLSPKSTAELNLSDTDNNSILNESLDTKNALLFALLAKIKNNENIPKMYIKFPNEDYDITEPNFINVILSKHIISKKIINKNKYENFIINNNNNSLTDHKIITDNNDLTNNISNNNDLTNNISNNNDLTNNISNNNVLANNNFDNNNDLTNNNFDNNDLTNNNFNNNDLTNNNFDNNNDLANNNFDNNDLANNILTNNNFDNNDLANNNFNNNDLANNILTLQHNSSTNSISNLSSNDNISMNELQKYFNIIDPLDIPINASKELSDSPNGLSKDLSKGLSKDLSKGLSKDLLQSNNTIVKIDSSKINPDCYHRYSYDLNKLLKVTEIKLLNFEIPKQSVINISDDNNKFTIDKHNFVIPNNYYNRFTLMDKINSLLFDIFGNDLILSLQDNYYKFTGNKKFMLIENSILFNMGFIKNSYVNKTEYIAEKLPNIGDNVFCLSIDSLSNDIMFIIDNDKKEVIKQNVNLVDYPIDSIDIHFHLNNSIINSFFFEYPHILTIQLAEATS